MKLGPLEWMLGATGVALLAAAVANKNPIDVAVSAFSGEESEPRPLAVRLSDTILAASTAAKVGEIVSETYAGATSNPKGEPTLVKIGQGGHQLRTDAAAAFKNWERAFGRQIIVTDSYRSFASQKASNAKDPGRFASPEGSAHPDGLAVDVNLGATTGGQSLAGQAQWDRLNAAAQATGWCTYSKGQAGKDTWHFSFKGCR